MFGLSCVVVAHLVTMVVDRVFAIALPQAYVVNAKNQLITVLLIASCWVYGLFWALLPFFGEQTCQPIRLNSQEI